MVRARAVVEIHQSLFLAGIGSSPTAWETIVINREVIADQD
jgi:hypothetical protein